MNLSAVLGAVVAVLVSLSGQSQCLQYFWARLAGVAPDKERQSRAELRTVKENGWSDRWSVRPLPPVTISVISWAGLGQARIQHGHHRMDRYRSNKKGGFGVFP